MKEYCINNEISSETIRLKDSCELISRSEALKRAADSNVDLIELSTYIDQSKISVCILQDYSKFLYRQKKIEKELKSKQVKTIVKELRFSSQISEHDYAFKLKHAQEFIKEKAKVKAYIIFHGREIMFKDQGESLLLRFANDLGSIARIESMPNLEGKKMTIILIPK